MTLQQFEYIVALHKLKHFAKAAEYCGVTQPTLSSMVQKLEEELGVKIFNRSTQPVETTPVGRLIVEQARHTLLCARGVQQTVDEQRQSISGTFRLAVLPTIAPYLIPRFFPQMMQTYPELDMRVVELQTAQIVRALQRSEIDAAIVARHKDLVRFDAVTLFYEKYFAYVAQGEKTYDLNQIRPADLNGAYLWLLEEGHCFRDQLVSFCRLQAARRSKRAYSLGSIETFMRIVESGKGVTFIPELATLQLMPAQRPLVRPFALPVPSREIQLVYSSHFIRRTLLQAVTDEIRRGVPQEMWELRQGMRPLV